MADVVTYESVPRTMGLFFVRFICESKGTSKNWNKEQRERCIETIIR